MMGDADQSYDFCLLPPFMERARAGSTFIMGSRLRGTIEPGAMPLLHRYLGTPVLTWILNLLFDTRISDCNCGMRCVERTTFFTLGVVSPGMEFASEMIVKAAVMGVRSPKYRSIFTRIGAHGVPTCDRSATAGATSACCCGTRRIR